MQARQNRTIRGVAKQKLTCTRSTHTKNVRICNLYSIATSASQSIKITRIISETSRPGMWFQTGGNRCSSARSFAKSSSSGGLMPAGARKSCMPCGSLFGNIERHCAEPAPPASIQRTENGSRPAAHARSRHGAKNGSRKASTAVIRFSGFGTSQRVPRWILAQ